jgi:hypothetical protein
VRLEPLYRVEFSYDEHYHVEAVDSLHAFFGEGRCEGFLTGRFRGLNHPRRRADDVYLPDYQGVIVTDDGATVWFDYRGYGRPRDYGREVLGTAFHQSGAQRYARLNDAVCVLAGAAEGTVIRLEVSELIWEPSAR